MVNDFTERRAESRTIIDQYYSVDFSVGNDSFLYQFKIWNLSNKGMCLLVKEGSAALNHLNVGDIVKMKYYKEDSSRPGTYLETEICHMTKYDEGQFKGHHLVGIQIIEGSGS